MDEKVFPLFLFNNKPNNNDLKGIGKTFCSWKCPEVEFKRPNSIAQGTFPRNGRFLFYYKNHFPEPFRLDVLIL